MKNIKARALAVLMTLVMVVGLLPAGALAEENMENSPEEVTVKEYHLMNRNSFWDYYENAVLEKASTAWGIVLNGMQIVDKDGISTWRQADAQAGNIYNIYAGRNGSTTDFIQPDEVDHITLHGTYATKWEWWAHSFSVDIPWGDFEVVTYGSQSDTQAYAEVYFSGEAPQPNTIDITFDLGYAPEEGDRTFVSTVIEGACVKEPFAQREGYNFQGWFADRAEEPFDFETSITAPLTLTAKWEVKEDPIPAAYTLTISYHYDNNGNGKAVSADELTKTLNGLALPGVSYEVSDGKIVASIAESALVQDGNSTKKEYDFGGFVFPKLNNGSELLHNGQEKNTVIAFDKEGIAETKLLYKDATVTPPVTKLDAWYFIRTDGLVPMENGSTSYPGNQYRPNHDTNGGLPGSVFKANSWSENYGPIVGDTINGVALSEAFAQVQDALAVKPNQAAIDAALAGFQGYDPETQGVIWYVVKTASHTTNGCPGYHVDGVLYTKGSDPTQVRVLNYLSNIPGDKKELLAYSVHGLGTSATVGSLLPTREGYDFMGWNTERNGSGTGYKAGETLVMDEDQTLYAQWKLKEDPQPPEKPTTKVEIFHFYVGGSTADDQVHDTAAEAALPDGGTVKRDYKGITKDYVNSLNTMEFYKDDLVTRNAEYTGYTVYAYNDKGEGGNTPIVFDEGEPLDLTNVKNLRIHLNYYQTRYSVVYNANGGTGKDVTMRYNTAVGYTVLGNTGESNPGFTREGYTFNGWSTDKEGTVKVEAGAPGTALEKNESVTYYAQWTKNEDPTPTTYKVTYEYTGSKPDGVNPPIDETRYEANTEVTLSTAPTAPANYTFGGWVLPEGLTVENGKFTMPDHDVTITGSWTYTAPSGGGDSGPTYRTVTVNYLEQDSNKVLADAYTLRDTYNSTYDVSAQAARAIDGYAISSTDGETSGRLLRNLTINVYYTAVEDIPEENPPLGPGPDTGDNGGTDIPDEETPLAPLPDTGDNGGTTGDDTVIEEENPPLGNLPQTGTTAQSVNPALTLGALALALSMAAAGLTISLTRKKEEEN